jgi:hypothetical protein
MKQIWIIILALTMCSMSWAVTPYPTAVPTFYQQTEWNATGSAVANYALTVPAASPYTVQLRYQPKDTTFTICTGVGGTGTCLAKVSTTPATGQFKVDFDDGIITFNVAQAGLAYYANFTSYGSIALASEQNEIRDNISYIADALKNGAKHDLSTTRDIYARAFVTWTPVGTSTPTATVTATATPIGTATSTPTPATTNTYDLNVYGTGAFNTLTFVSLLPYGPFSVMGASDNYIPSAYIKYAYLNKVDIQAEDTTDPQIRVREYLTQDDSFQVFDDGRVIITEQDPFASAPVLQIDGYTDDATPVPIDALQL